MLRISSKYLKSGAKCPSTVSWASRCTKLLQSGPRGTVSQRILELLWLRFLLLFYRITSRGSPGIARSAPVQMELWRVNFRNALLQNHSNARRWLVDACLLCPKRNSSFHFLLISTPFRCFKSRIWMPRPTGRMKYDHWRGSHSKCLLDRNASTRTHLNCY